MRVEPLFEAREFTCARMSWQISSRSVRLNEHTLVHYGRQQSEHTKHHYCLNAAEMLSAESKSTQMYRRTLVSLRRETSFSRLKFKKLNSNEEICVAI